MLNRNDNILCNQCQSSNTVDSLTFSSFNEAEQYEGYYGSPKPGAPLVFLIHDCDGFTEYELKRAEMLSQLGYAVFAADLFGKGIRPDSVEKRRKLNGELFNDHAKMRALMNAGLNTAQSQGGKVSTEVAMGYCFGGTAVPEWVRSGADLKGFVTFHGGLQTPQGQDYAKAKGGFLILHGSAGKAVSLDQFAALGKKLEAAGLEHEMITYSGAPHAFSVFGSSRYREKADRKSWVRFVDYLADTLK